MLNAILTKQVVTPFCIIVGAVLLYAVVSKIIRKLFLAKKGKNNKKQQTLLLVILNIFKCFLAFIAVLMILDVYGVDTKALIASLGVIGVVAGLALQDLLKDFIAGVSIIFESQYSIGDTVTINGFKGEVMTLGIKTTRLKAYTGEIKIIANRTVVEVINHSIDDSLAIVNIDVPYQTDIEKLKQILDQLCVKMTHELSNLTGDITCLGINSLKDSNIEFQITGYTKPMMHFETQREIRKQVRLELNKHHIGTPYQHVVTHNE